MPLPVPVASPESDPSHDIPQRAESALSPPLSSPAVDHRPDRAEIERELLTRLQEVAVETIFAHLGDTSIDPAPLAVDLVLGMERSQR